MDLIPEATDEDAAAVPNIFYTFFRWMVQNGRRDSTAKTYARQMIVLFEEDNKSPAGMATEDYFMLVKNSFKNKSGNSQRSASVKQFMEFWLDRGSKPMEDCGNDKRFQIKSRPVRSKAALPETESEEAKKLRADLELPSEGWSVVVRSRETGDLIAAVSPGGTAYYTREAVDRRLGRKSAGGAEPPPAPLPPAAGKADAAKPAAEAARPAPAAAAQGKAPAAAEPASEAKKDAKKEEAKKQEAKKEEAKKEEAKKEEARKEEARKEEAKKEEARKEEAKKEEARKEEAKKAEAKKAELKKEEAKKEEMKKEEIKDEVKKEEVKEEVKEVEVKKAVEVKNELKDEDGDKEEKKEEVKEGSERKKKSRKHRDVDTLDGLLNDTQDIGDLTTPHVETDTEYTEEVDFKASPQKLHVKDSGSHKTDGEYTQLLDASRGRPCYVKWGEKPVYMYWNRKWKIGMEFGSSKAYAMVKDCGALVPCEPFPNIWRVIDKKDKKEKKDKDKKEAKSYVKNLAMRVIDAEVLSLSMGEDGLGLVIPSEDAHPVKRAKRRTWTPTASGDEAKADRSPSSGGAAKEPVTNGAVPSDEGVGPADSEDEEDEKVEEQVDSSSESNSSESSSSDSGASDSEDEGKKEEEKKEVKPVAAKPTAFHASEQKAAEFESKLRNQLLTMPTLPAKLAKLQHIKDMFTKKMGLENVTGMSSDKVVALLDKLARECGAKQGSLAAAQQPKAKPPSGPPPAWLLEKKVAASPAAPAEEKAVSEQWAFEFERETAEDQRSLADLYAHAEPPRPSPMTPEQIQGQFEEPPTSNGAEWWRQRIPKRSALRKPGEPRRARRIAYRDADGINYLVNQVEISCYRSCGEALWFVAPGSYVKCDNCEKEVTQAMGSLQGAPSQSQFAQHCFLCQECSGM